MDANDKTIATTGPRPRLLAAAVSVAKWMQAAQISNAVYTELCAALTEEAPAPAEFGTVCAIPGMDTAWTGLRKLYHSVKLEIAIEEACGRSHERGTTALRVLLDEVARLDAAVLMANDPIPEPLELLAAAEAAARSWAPEGSPVVTDTEWTMRLGALRAAIAKARVASR